MGPLIVVLFKHFCGDITKSYVFTKVKVSNVLLSNSSQYIIGKALKVNHTGVFVTFTVTEGHYCLYIAPFSFFLFFLFLSFGHDQGTNSEFITMMFCAVPLHFKSNYKENVSFKVDAISIGIIHHEINGLCFAVLPLW